jgi:hypothetical protein
VNNRNLDMIPEAILEYRIASFLGSFFKNHSFRQDQLAPKSTSNFQNQILDRSIDA